MVGEHTTLMEIQNPSSSSFPNDEDDNDRGAIFKKINYVFGNVCDKLNGTGGGLVQFWATKKDEYEEEDDKVGRCILSTFNQPFAQFGESSNTNILAYRKCSIQYYYTIINNYDNYDGNDIMKMYNAPAVTAFLNHLPELVMDMRSMVDHYEEEEDWCPLLGFALKSGFTCCLFMPVFIPTSLSSSCVGVVECCMKKQSSKGLLLVFSYLKSALETVGLSTFDVQQFRPCETICGLKLATYEIEKALEIVCESHYLNLAQVWISYENESHVLFSSSPTKQMFALKLISYCVDLVDGHLFSSLMDYHDTCETLPLKIGQGLAGKTLQIYEPLFHRNISELSDSGPLRLLPANNKCSCLTICLRSTHTKDVDYVLEFLWPQRRNYLILIESLLLTLKRCLPSFTFSFGAKLGDRLRVVDVENSTGSKMLWFHIFHRNILSRLPKTLVGRKRPVAKEYTSPMLVKCKTTSIPLYLNGVNQISGCTMEEDATNRNERQGQNFLKKKLSDLCESQIESIRKSCASNKGQGQNFLKKKLSDLCESQSESFRKSCASSSNSETSPSDEILTIKARNAGDMIKFLLPISSATLASVKNEIDMGFELSGRYKLMYLDEDQVWNGMDSDEHVRSSIHSMRLANSTHIRLCVIPPIS